MEVIERGDRRQYGVDSTVRSYLRPEAQRIRIRRRGTQPSDKARQFPKPNDSPLFSGAVQVFPEQLQVMSVGPSGVWRPADALKIEEKHTDRLDRQMAMIKNQPSVAIGAGVNGALDFHTC